VSELGCVCDHCIRLTGRWGQISGTSSTYQNKKEFKKKTLCGHPGTVGDCSVAPLTSKHSRDFLLYDLTTLLETVPEAVRARMWYMHNGAPAHFSRAVRDVLSNAYQDWWIGRGEGPMYGLNARQILILCIFTCEDTHEPLCMQLLLTTKRHFTIALWMSVRLSETIPASLNGWGGPWWDVSRRALNLMQDILGTDFKRTLSAINYKLNISGHMLIWPFIHILVCGTRAQNLSAPLNYIL
jgi:hypothetical protein